ncbi:MAG TPA: hypothetical protein P5057_00880, partial [Acidobacteriota bacterium]|nr:hypothetical protein [Acidobacteriota bacterium]
ARNSQMYGLYFSLELGREAGKFSRRRDLCRFSLSAVSFRDRSLEIGRGYLRGLSADFRA